MANMVNVYFYGKKYSAAAAAVMASVAHVQRFTELRERMS